MECSQAPASASVEAHSKVGDGCPQQRLPDGEGQVQNGLGQGIAPGWEELVLPLLVEHRQCKHCLWNLQHSSLQLVGQQSFVCL